MLLTEPILLLKALILIWICGFSQCHRLFGSWTCVFIVSFLMMEFSQNPFYTFQRQILSLLRHKPSSTPLHSGPQLYQAFMSLAVFTSPHQEPIENVSSELRTLSDTQVPGQFGLIVSHYHKTTEDKRNIPLLICEPSLKSLFPVLNVAAQQFLKLLVVSYKGSRQTVTAASKHLYGSVIGILNIMTLQKQSAESCGRLEPIQPLESSQESLYITKPEP